MSKILVSSYHSKLAEVVKNNSDCNTIMRNITKFIDVNNETLYDIGPNYRLFIDDKDRGYLFEITGITETELKNIFKTINDIDEKWTIITPFNILSTLMIRECVLSKKTKLSNLLIMHLTLSLYSSLQFKYFKYLPNRAAMEYTINNMTNKYLIKKYGVLYKALEHIAIKSHEKYEKDLIRGNDLDIKNYIMNLRTRLNNFMKIIASEYMINLSNKKYLNTSEDSRDEENYVETSNLSLKIEQYVLGISNKFYGSSINPKFVRIAASMCSVHAQTLDQSMNAIKIANNKDASLLIRYILKIYFNNSQNSLDSAKSKRFMQYMLQIYSKSNIKDEDVIDMKKLLDHFLLNYCERYSNTEREATKVSYRKATFVYFLLHIQTCLVSMK